ncbi:NADPH oxidase organizer 1 [Dicentrarchus labrax]|uniref:NADPH oxidase organizer 1a n=1 Tax=Dicentrarchus labrax TaxID=13489 RepID=A0A8C4ELF8_DICLA|nr:NADPH oxidase organizer 1 [Dicentrarchus labrax]
MEAQRYPLSVRVIGVMHKEKSKMYMTSVLWSDQNDIVVYRTFRDFKKMHRQMKKAFPSASKLKKSDRVIPRFRDKKMKRSGRKKKGPTKSLVRLKFLQKYCDELLTCDPRVCQSADLIQFFQPKAQDLQPEFSKNSIMIMPSDDELGANAGHGNGGNVTQPFVTETYRCVATYETKDTKNKPFKVAVDENVDVLIKDKAGWWLVENEDKRMAWFPAPYLEKLDDDDDEEDIDGTPERGMMYTAVKGYNATNDDEITVGMGAVVTVLQKSENGWWLIRYNDKAGYIPTMYLQPYRYPHIRMGADHQARRASSPLQVPSLSLEQQSHQFSHSQGNLLQLPPGRSSSPRPLQADSRQRSHSLNVLSEQLPAQPAASTTASAARASAATVPDTPTTGMLSPPPTIMVEMDGDEEQHGRSLTADSDGSLSSNSSDFSFSDDLSSSSASSTFNLSHSANDEQLRLSRTPPPMVSNRLSPSSGQEGKMMPSVSDPNLYKGPTTPKVPPRPRAQEILTRCTTVTRKNATKGTRSPTQTEILSR